jgi:hypothetical protein
MFELDLCPNGERVTRTEKMVGLCLADNHQDKGNSFTFPALETIAQTAKVDRRTCQRMLESLERKGVILRLRPRNQGRGTMVFYYFQELDQLPEGWQDAALSERPFILQKGGKRAAEGRQKGGIPYTSSLTNRELEQRQLKQEQLPLTPSLEGGLCKTENQHATDPQETSAESVATPDLRKMDAGDLRDRKRPGSDERPHALDASLAERTAGAETEEAAGTRRKIDGAVDQVMQACGFTAKHLRPVLAAVIEQQYDKGDPRPTTALALIDAWRRYILQAARLRFTWNARRFFAEGYWRSSDMWPWDNRVLREERLLMEAKTGSRR